MLLGHPWELWFALAVVIVMVYGLARNLAADMITMGCLALVMAASPFSKGKLLPSVEQAVAGFGNSALLTVAVLFVVVTGLVRTGAMTMLTNPIIGQPKTTMAAQLRLLFPVMGLSTFLNNTPCVAMFMPVVDDICKKYKLSPSKLYLPLVYASVFGGCCSLIGTSTNIVVDGLIGKAIADGRLKNFRQLEMFDITWVGLPAAVVGIVFVIVASKWLLPDRKPAISLSDDPRQYTVEMIVQPGGSMVGQTIEDAGLRHLPGLFLIEIERGQNILPAVSPNERLEENDRLIFVGIVESVVDLQKIRGLQPATNQVFKLNDPRTQRCLIEAVVSDRCPIVGKTIRDGQFRRRYEAAVLAVARSGERINAKIGDIVLKSGDTLLLEAHQSFESRMRNHGDFFLVSSVQNSTPPRHEKAWIAILIMIVMILTNLAEWFDIMTAATIAAGLMILTKCCTAREARESLEIDVLVSIGASFGIGKALESSGAAQLLADSLTGAAQAFGGGRWVVLAAVYLATMILTELITNNAAAVLVFPIAIAAADKIGANPMPFIISIMVASSAGYATPTGYQCNLMVMGPGGYRFSDYLRMGIPLDLLYMLVTVTLAPMVWPF
ncbi:MAG: di-/tricarboxylate transporter [Planctomycetota bacterium]|nr:MAG: di-/tricarboxylate transporter [Planctomycetota bacterium]